MKKIKLVFIVKIWPFNFCLSVDEIIQLIGKFTCACITIVWVRFGIDFVNIKA